jgi:FAD/FMN-containing dehydrogenase
VLSGLRRLRKDNAGYDWKQLFIGTEGTLGIVTAAILRLLPHPRHRATIMLSIPDPEAAIRLLDKTQRELGEAISAFELISATSLALVEEHLQLTPPIAKGEWFLLIEAASSLSGLREGVEALLEKIFKEGSALDGVIAQSEAQARQLWVLREAITEAEAREGRSLKHDVSLPLDAMPAFLRDVAAALDRIAKGVRPNIFGHLGDGNLHYNVLLKPGVDGSDVSRIIHDLVVEFDGSISAEHGIGQYRVEELRRLRSRDEQDFCRTLKWAIDPENSLNPGKVFSLGHFLDKKAPFL